MSLWNNWYRVFGRMIRRAATESKPCSSNGLAAKRLEPTIMFELLEELIDAKCNRWCRRCRLR